MKVEGGSGPSEGQQGKYAELTGQIINAFYAVYNALGHGFSERVYRDALSFELRSRGLFVAQEFLIPVFYRGVEISRFYADIVVNECVIVELKACQCIADEHRAQLLNYLRATPIEVGLLLNFGPKASVERKVFDNDLKGRGKQLAMSSGQTAIPDLWLLCCGNLSYLRSSVYPIVGDLCLRIAGWSEY